jgi:drug/metabolite transporter (DMT)-like permease
VLAWIILDQKLNALQLIGSALVLAGVVVAERVGATETPLEAPDALASV